MFDDYTLKHPDGTTLFINTDSHTFPVQIYIDVNGIKKGPNRFGYYMFLIIEYGKDQNDKNIDLWVVLKQLIKINIFIAV